MSTREPVFDLMFRLRNPFRTPPERVAGHALYTAVIGAARDPKVFTSWSVPDTPEGRFEMLALTTFLLLKRLKTDDANKEVAQAVFDIMFEDLDSNLRELGVGDVGVSKKIKKMAEGFYGRISAYQSGLENGSDDAGLIAALLKYVYRDQPPDESAVASLAAFTRRQDAHLARQSDKTLRSGQVTFLGADTMEETP